MNFLDGLHWGSLEDLILPGTTVVCVAFLVVLWFGLYKPPRK